ncbi:MAG TPA: hypothetical protein VGJ82_23445 [Thermoanaerobaculia bacterium]|jgi:hypothetical protein
MRRRIAFILFVALAILAFDPSLFRFVLANRAAMHAGMTRYPDRGWEGYPAFLEEVRAHTKAGDSIALVVPSMHWDNGYSYAYYRASYFLAGREVLPLVDRGDVPQRANFTRAKYVAAWRRRVQGPVHPVWSGEGGTLLER